MSRKIRFSLVWVIPILVGILTFYLGWKAFWNMGLIVTNAFETADSIVSGQIQIKYKSVILGTVKNVSLDKDMVHFNFQIFLSRRTTSLITNHSCF